MARDKEAVVEDEQPRGENIAEVEIPERTQEQVDPKVEYDLSKAIDEARAASVAETSDHYEQEKKK